MIKIKVSSYMLKFLLLLFLIIFLYRFILYELVLDWWRDENYSHGFIIPFVAGYMIWKKKNELKKIPKTSSWIGIWFVLIGIALFLLGTAGSETFTTRISFIITLAGITLCCLGKETSKRLITPYLILFLMVPLPHILYNSLTLPLKLLAAKLSTTFISFLSIPVFREGNIIHLATMNLQIVEACSGMRSIMSLLTLGIILAFFSQNKKISKIILILSTLPVGILINSIRITVTGILSNYNTGIAQNFYHLFSGWIMFIIGVLVLILFNSILNFIERYRH